MEINNFFLQKHKNNVAFLLDLDKELFIQDWLCELGYDLYSGNAQSWQIDWSSGESLNSYDYDYENCEEEVTKMFLNSDLRNEDYFLLDIEYDKPLLKVEGRVFINYWRDFLGASGFSGMLIIGKETNSILEFTDNDFQIISNIPLFNSCSK